MTDEAHRVLRHPGVIGLRALDALLEQATTRAAEDTPEAVIWVARLKAMSEHANATLTGGEPVLVTDQVLNQVDVNVQNIVTYLNNYIAGTSAGGSLANALTEADALFAALARVPALIGGQKAAAITRSMGAYHETVEAYTRRIQEQQTAQQSGLAQFASVVGSLEQRVASLESRIDSMAGQQQSTFEISQSQRQQAFDTAQVVRQQSFDQELAVHRAEINRESDVLRTRVAGLTDSAKTELEDAVKALDDAIGETKNAVREKATEVDATYREMAESIRAHLQERRDEADKLVGMIGERGVTSSYQKTANEARLEMWIWHVVTVGVIGSLIFAISVEFLPALKSGWNWGIGGARLMLTVVATLLASYSATQAKLARDMMRKNRRREMDLSALGPYLASLPEPEQNELRGRIADRYFVQDENPGGPASGIESLLSDPEVAKEIKGLPRTAILAALATVRSGTK